ncbi:hypothetical protein OG292_19655 [Streptomyces sp. NBC_01511]|uniref:hypothetical protein n=1 Tax=Streptomyces sp. NBC_01511 TaxID=2903889 RepID=UPI00386FEDC3
MGSRLYVEVLDYAPETLTHREKLFLAVLADDARDTTRITWSSVESPKTLRRGKVSRAQVYEVIKALISKGCLERISAGQKNGTAKYRILPLQSPEIPDADTSAQGPDSADTDDPQSQGFPDTDAESQRPENADTDPSQRPETPDTDPESQCPQNPDTDESQCPEIPDVSVRESRTPTLSPLSTRPLSFGDDPSDPAGQDDAEPQPEIEAEIITAQVIVGEWLERCAVRPPSAVIGQMSKQIRVLLDEDHIHPDLIRRGIATWMQKRLHPSTLPSVVNEVMNAPADGPTTRQAPGNNLFDPASGTTVFDRARARAAARTAQEGPTT